MTKFSAKHIAEVIGGTLCSLVEKDIDKERLDFLTKLLQKNNYEVFYEEIGENKYKIGVNDLLFFPVIDVYKRRLKTLDDNIVSHEYWLQIPKEHE